MSIAASPIASFPVASQGIEPGGRVRLTWTDTNYGETELRVYWDVVPIDLDALPPVLATLPPDSTSYIHTAPEEEARNYYVVSAICQGEENFSAEVFADV